MPEGPVVADAGPLIAFSMTGSLHLLEKLYGQVLVPDEVFREIAEAGSGRVGSTEVASAEWLNRVTGHAVAEPLLSMNLGPGESQVISVAFRLGARLVILDDRKARRIAEQAYRLPIKGSAAVLVDAKRAGLVLEVRPLLAAMIERGYFLSERLCERACLEVGEVWVSQR